MNITAIILLLTINVIFFFKFSVIYTHHPLSLTSLYFLFFCCSTFAFQKNYFFKILSSKNVLILSIAITISLLLYTLILPRIGDIGRLQAIEDWIQRFNNGTFPYNSPHTPSSYPVIFFLAIPFYYIGNTGLLSFIGIALLIFIIYKLNYPSRNFIFKLFIVFSSIVVLYEIVTRSELILNIMLVVLVIYSCDKFLNIFRYDRHFFLLAVLTGLVLATRSISAILFLIYFLYKFRDQFKSLIFFGITAIAVFIVFVIPFYFWNPESFMKNGPFAVQSYLSNLPILVILFFFTVSFYIGRIIRNTREYFFTAGILLFIMAMVSFILRALSIGFYDSLINDGYDIAYFIFGMPFLILSISIEQSNT